MASLWIGSGAGWPLKGLGLASPNYQVGAHFEALFKGVLVAASKSIETFFAISTFPELRCVGPQHFMTFLVLLVREGGVGVSN